MQVLLDTPHPANQMLARLARAQSAQALSLQLAEYRDLLARFDWQFEFSEDRSVRIRAQAHLDRIRALQPYVDADRALFDAARLNTHGSATL